MSELKSAFTKLSVVSIPEKVLLPGVIKALDGREMFRDTDDELDEKMYAGHIFEDIAGEQSEMGGSPIRIKDDEVLKQLDELAELVSEDYVLITKI